MKIMNIVKNNGKTILGVVSGLAIAGVSLATAMSRKSDDVDYDIYDEEGYADPDDASEEETTEEMSEE